jgi:outer membrane lipoprotein-sorting protein
MKIDEATNRIESLTRRIAQLMSMIALLALGSGVQAGDATAILKQVDMFRNPLDSFVIDVQLKSHRKNESETSTFKVYGQGPDKSLVEFVSPASEKGRYLLMLRDAMWIYMPNTRRPIRISPLQRLMGEASNGDVARTNYTVDYLPELAGEDVIDGVEAFILDLAAKDKDISYSRVKLWVSRKNYEPIQADFYVVSGMLMKRALFKEFGILNGRRTVTGMEIHDMRRKGLWTELRYSNLQPKTLSDKLFNKNYLGKW